MSPAPFTIKVPDSSLSDLHNRLDAAIFPDQVTNAGWEQGTELGYLRELVHYWRNDFDWRAVENRLNELPQFTMKIQDLDVHFIHVKGRGETPAPLLISHGWPSSFAEMTKLIPLLTDPADTGGAEDLSFDVVVPSLPGFIFSEAAPEGGMNAERMASIFDELMTRLGYNSYAVHGGDVGSVVSTAMALKYPDRVVGAHVTSVALVSPWIDEDSPALTDAETAYNEGRKSWMSSEGAYYMIQSTKPQSLAYGLTDSPVGLAAWILEKFQSWSDCHGDIESRFTKDELLTNISLYWFTRSIGSASRFYLENRVSPLKLKEEEKITGVNGVSVFPADISLPPREWAERTFDLVHYNFLPRGGHFSALEEPELLAAEIRATFQYIRAIRDESVASADSTLSV